MNLFSTSMLVIGILLTSFAVIAGCSSISDSNTTPPVTVQHVTTDNKYTVLQCPNPDCVNHKYTINYQSYDNTHGYEISYMYTAIDGKYYIAVVCNKCGAMWKTSLDSNN
jgi:aspartate carbamoyltransferase regulatory subunit